MLEALKPKKVFRFFEEISQIPHGSGNTTEISNYLVKFARDRELEYIQDEMQNVIIIKEATEGYEDKEAFILQGHMDMVAVSDGDARIDMLREGLELEVCGDYVSAKGTSLGGDDGIAVAYALALLDSEEIPHPRLEIVITVEEEVGMEGAFFVDLSTLKGKRLLNIDSDEEGKLTTGCAGGVRVNGRIPVDWEELAVGEATKEGGWKQEYKAYRILITRLAGGHSGLDIWKSGGNANLLMGELTGRLLKQAEARPNSLAGGTKDNVIPCESELTVLVKSEKSDVLLGIVHDFDNEIRERLQKTDPDVRIEIGEIVILGIREISVLRAESADKVCQFLENVPDGVWKRRPSAWEEVMTSLNCGIIRLEETGFMTTHLIRSEIKTDKKELADTVTDMVKKFQGEAVLGGDYPSWEHREKSELRERMIQIYRKLYQKEPKVTTDHAGLECGILADKIKDLDCISFGPDMENIHTTQERISVSSVERTWKFLLAVLKEG